MPSFVKIKCIFMVRKIVQLLLDAHGGVVVVVVGGGGGGFQAPSLCLILEQTW